VLLLAWTRVFGASAFALRAMSIAAFACTTVFSAAAARYAGSARGAWLTATLVACSVPFGLEPAATTRPYALAALCAAMTLWAALRVDETTSTTRAAVPLLISHLLGLFTHPVFVLVSAASAVAGLLSSRRRLLAAAPAAAVAIYVATWWRVISQTAALPARTWMTPPGAGDLLTGLQFWGDHGTPVLAVLLGILLIGRRARRARNDMRGLTFALAMVVLVFAGAFFISRTMPIYEAARTPIFVLPAAAVVFGVAIAETAPVWVTAAAALMVIVSGVRYSVRTYERPDPFPTRASLSVVASRVTCGDTIVAAGLSYAPVIYYAPAARLPACVHIVAFPEDVREHPGWLDLTGDAVAALPGAASAFAARLPATGIVWAFVQMRGVGERQSEAAIQAMSATRSMREALPLSGSFFDEVRVFGKPTTGRRGAYDLYPPARAPRLSSSAKLFF
jgi:hypothetical protein